MSKESASTLDKKTLMPIGAVIGLLFIVFPAVTWIINLNSQVQAQAEKIDSQQQILIRIDERTREIQLDVQDLKTRSDLIQ